MSTSEDANASGPSPAADLDTLAMPPPAVKLGGFPWSNTQRVASKDIQYTVEEEIPALEDVTTSYSAQFGISQEALDDAAEEINQLQELEFVLGIYPNFDQSVHLEPSLDDVWVESYEGLMKGFRKNELLHRIVMRAARDVRCQKLLGHQTDFENDPEEERDD